MAIQPGLEEDGGRGLVDGACLAGPLAPAPGHPGRVGRGDGLGHEPDGPKPGQARRLLKPALCPLLDLGATHELDRPADDGFARLLAGELPHPPEHRLEQQRDEVRKATLVADALRMAIATGGSRLAISGGEALPEIVAQHFLERAWVAKLLAANPGPA